MTTIKDTNIYSTLVSATSLKKVNASYSTTFITTMTTKRKFETFMEDLEKYGTEDHKKIPTDEKCKDIPARLLAFAEEKRPKLVQLMKETSAEIVTKLNSEKWAGLWSMAMSQVTAAKRAETTALRVKEHEAMKEEIKRIMNIEPRDLAEAEMFMYIDNLVKTARGAAFAALTAGDE